MNDGFYSAATADSTAPVLITGGCGFIGANLANRLLNEGTRVVLFDNLSRAGVERNWQWLQGVYGGAVELRVADTRDAEAVSEAVENVSAVFHLAAQVAVTTSLETPVTDFEINARGTLNVLEALRALPEPPPLLYTSSNKVYGSLSDLSLVSSPSRYEPMDGDVWAAGIDESQRLDFYSPYGCSKGTADQYVLEYARTYGLAAVVFRLSCIYGPRQFGNEDQGWVTHFLIQALEDGAITIFGDGRQVRDVLFIDDLVEAMMRAWRQSALLSGQAFNIGGGVQHTLSLLELLDLLGELNGRAPRIEWGPWRAGDQCYYVSNMSRFSRVTGWQPRVGVREGVQRLHGWLRESAAFEALSPL